MDDFGMKSDYQLLRESYDPFKRVDLPPYLEGEKQFAFHPSARQEIMERDHWECQTCDRTGAQGYHMNAAHYPDLHGAKKDRKIENGRCSCVRCHIVEEIGRGNLWGAKQLYKNQTIRHYGWIRDHGGLDEKPPFEAFIYEAENIFTEV